MSNARTAAERIAAARYATKLALKHAERAVADADRAREYRMAESKAA
jgi:hypothetical protein